MLKKSIKLLKNNPMLVMPYALLVLLTAALTLLFMPEIRSVLEFAKNMSGSSSMLYETDPQQIMGTLGSTLKIYLFALLVAVLSILFMSGYGNMFAAAVNEGKASLKIFIYGIRRFFGKTLLSALLFMAISFGFGAALSLITMPFMIARMISNGFSTNSITGLQSILQIVSITGSAFLYPFVELWIPAIFLNRSDGVIACFRKGLGAGKGKYLVLLGITAVMVLPLLILYIFNGNIYTILDSPLYYLSFIYQAILMPIVLAYLFILYSEMKAERQ